MFSTIREIFSFLINDANLPVLCWNVHGLNLPARRTIVSEVASLHKIAIICSQETKVDIRTPQLVREIGRHYSDRLHRPSCNQDKGRCGDLL